MGQILSQPITDKTSEHGEDERRLIYGLSSMQGWRVSMEDAHATVLDLKAPNSEPTDKKIAFFGVYDGHGGERIAAYSGENLHNIVAKQDGFAKKDYSQALKDGFLATDRAILDDAQYKYELSGCTATTAIITDDKIIVGNAGDSRTVLGVSGYAKPLSFDHKPQNEGEKSRIYNAGGFVEVGRVNGNLALSRAIGDFEFKRSAELPAEEQTVTAYPDVIERTITDSDEFLVLACDGIWDCMNSQAVVEFVRRGIAFKQGLDQISENLMENCLAPASDVTGIGCDNMTVIIVGLLNGKTKEEWYDMIASRVANGEGPAAPEDAAIAKKSSFSGNQAASSDNSDEEPSDDERARTLILQRILGGQVNVGGAPQLFEPGSRAASLMASFGLTESDDVEVQIVDEIDGHENESEDDEKSEPDGNDADVSVKEIENVDKEDSEEAKTKTAKTSTKEAEEGSKHSTK